jgi:hypothetical protein
MRKSWQAYRATIWKHGKALVSGAFAGIVGIALSIYPVVVPAWIWFLVALASVAWLGFVVFHDVYTELASVRREIDIDEQRAKVEQEMNFLIVQGRNARIFARTEIQLHRWIAEVVSLVESAYGHGESAGIVDVLYAAARQDTSVSSLDLVDGMTEKLLDLIARSQSVPIRKQFDIDLWWKGFVEANVPELLPTLSSSATEPTSTGPR